MTYAEARAQVYAALIKAGRDPNRSDPQHIEWAVQHTMDQASSPLWARIKWAPYTLMIQTQIWIMQGMTLLIKLATPRT